MQKLCNGDYERPIVAKLMDGSDSDNLKLMGELTLSANELIAAMDSRHWVQGKGFPLTRASKSSGSKKQDGHLQLVNVQ